MGRLLTYHKGIGLLFVAATAVVAIQWAAWDREARAQTKEKAAATKSQTPGADPHAQDRASIGAAIDSFAKAFVARDAKTLAAHWTAEGEYENDQGVAVRGRDALEAAFADFFTRSPDVQTEVTPRTVRFLSKDAAIAEGTVAVRRGPAQPAKVAHYSALFVREDGQWRMATLRESSFTDNMTIDQLGWLIGEWKSAAGQGAEIRTAYSWDPSKKFINVRFTIQEQTVGFGGSQVIGVDPATAGIRSWTFEASGGVGEADWHADGDHWVLDAVGTLPDGRTLTQTNVLRRINADTFTWQSINRLLGDVPLPDLPPVKVTRVKSDR